MLNTNEPIKRYGEADSRFQKRHNVWQQKEETYKRQQDELNAESKRREPMELQEAIDRQTIQKIARSLLFAEIKSISTGHFSINLVWTNRVFGCPAGETGSIDLHRCYINCEQVESEMELLPDEFNRTTRYLRHLKLEELSVGDKGELLYCFSNALASLDLKNYIFVIDKKEETKEQVPEKYTSKK